MDLFGGADSFRYFKIISVNNKKVKDEGRYKTKASPGDAAKKAFTQLSKKYKTNKLTFSIKETTQGSTKKEHGPYLGEKIKLKKPLEVKYKGKNKPVIIKYETKIHLVKTHKQKGGSNPIKERFQRFFGTYPERNININNNWEIINRDSTSSISGSPRPNTSSPGPNTGSPNAFQTSANAEEERLEAVAAAAAAAAAGKKLTLKEKRLLREAKRVEQDKSHHTSSNSTLNNLEKQLHAPSSSYIQNKNYEEWLTLPNVNNNSTLNNLEKKLYAPSSSSIQKNNHNYEIWLKNLQKNT